jgi:hypothetical protein
MIKGMLYIFKELFGFIFVEIDGDERAKLLSMSLQISEDARC